MNRINEVTFHSNTHLPVESEIVLFVFKVEKYNRSLIEQKQINGNLKIII